MPLTKEEKKKQLQNTLTTLDQNLRYCDLKGILVIHLYTKVEKTDNTHGTKALSSFGSKVILVFLLLRKNKKKNPNTCLNNATFD